MFWARKNSYPTAGQAARAAFNSFAAFLIDSPPSASASVADEMPCVGVEKDDWLRHDLSYSGSEGPWGSLPYGPFHALP
ncbi:hypothetical protein ASD65_06265 [Microbacterium sp. Root61]|nr:hypothetical protein ASD65_06265 [Microbacterium sp. Root61]